MIIDQINTILGLTSEYNFITVWVALILLAFVFYNLMSLITMLFRRIGGWK